jgi:hypothetical protein
VAVTAEHVTLTRFPAPTMVGAVATIVIEVDETTLAEAAPNLTVGVVQKLLPKIVT